MSLGRFPPGYEGKLCVEAEIPPELDNAFTLTDVITRWSFWTAGEEPVTWIPATGDASDLVTADEGRWPLERQRDWYGRGGSKDGKRAGKMLMVNSRRLAFVSDLSFPPPGRISGLQCDQRSMELVSRRQSGVYPQDGSEKLKEGEAIVYSRGSLRVVHRVIGQEKEKEQLFTKGDANEEADAMPVSLWRDSGGKWCFSFRFSVIREFLLQIRRRKDYGSGCPSWNYFVLVEWKGEDEARRRKR